MFVSVCGYLRAFWTACGKMMMRWGGFLRWLIELLVDGPFVWKIGG